MHDTFLTSALLLSPAMAIACGCSVIVALSAQHISRTDLIRSLKCISAHTWEGFESGNVLYVILDSL